MDDGVQTLHMYLVKEYATAGCKNMQQPAAEGQFSGSWLGDSVRDAVLSGRTQEIQFETLDTVLSDINRTSWSVQGPPLLMNC